jgi:hypothetical protein
VCSPLPKPVVRLDCRARTSYNDDRGGKSCGRAARYRLVRRTMPRPVPFPSAVFACPDLKWLPSN